METLPGRYVAGTIDKNVGKEEHGKVEERADGGRANLDSFHDAPVQ